MLVRMSSCGMHGGLHQVRTQVCTHTCILQPGMHLRLCPA